MTEAQIIGRRIAAARALRSLTQTQLGKVVGLTYRAIGEMEAGRSIPRADRIAAMARELRVSADYLLGLTEDMAPKTSLPAALVA